MFRRLGLGFRLLLCAGALLAPVSECLAQAGAATGPSQTRSGGALPVVIEVRSSGLDPEGVKVAIERELGVPLRVDAVAAQRLEIIVTGRRANVSYFAPSVEPVTRSVDLPRDRDRATETIAFLAGNLARDEAAALLAELRPPEAPAEEVPPPPLPPAPTSASAESAPAPPPAVQPAPSTPEPKPAALLEADRFAFNLSLFPPVTLLPNTERRRLNLELGMIHSRLGALRGAAFTLGYLKVLGPAEGFVYALGWSRTGDMKGVQLAHLVNEGHGKLTGFSHGDLVNVRTGDVEGLQMAGVVALSHDVVGSQIGGVVSRTFAQQGATVGGIANLAQGEVEGAQIGGIASVAQRVDGAQVAGIANVAGDVNGVQIGLVNVGGKVNGMQLGLINVSQEIHGGALGLVNVAGNGRVQPIGWISGGTDLRAMGGVKFVTDFTYVFVGVGSELTKTRRQTEAGTGLHLEFGPAYGEAGVAYSLVTDGDGSSEQAIRQDFKYELRLGYEVLPWFTLFVGGGLAQRLQGEGTPLRGEYSLGLTLF